jgi:hypothetical protein
MIANMALNISNQILSPNTPSPSIIRESPSFEKKLQTQLDLFAKALLKESTNDIALLSHQAHNFACTQNNTLPELTVGIGRTPTWQQEMLYTAFREISEWARSSIDERSFMPGSAGPLSFAAEMIFLELTRTNPETQLLSPGSLRAATEISRSCISQKMQPRILTKNIQLIHTLKTLHAGVSQALEILTLYRGVSSVEQEFIDTPFIPADSNRAPWQINQLIDPKVLHRALVDTIGPNPRSIELQGLLIYSAALTLWMSVYDELLWVIQHEWIQIGPWGNFRSNTCLHLDLHLAILSWQILEQHRKYNELSANTLRNLILSEHGYPNGNMEDFRDISSIPLEQICIGFPAVDKKSLIDLIRFSPKRFWDTGFPQESLIWFLRQNPTYIEKALTLLKQLTYNDVSNSELIRMLELRVSGRQAKWLRTSADVAAILTWSSKKPDLYIVATPTPPIEKPNTTQIILAPVPAQQAAPNPIPVALTPFARQQERLRQLSTNYNLTTELQWTGLLDKQIIDACFTYAKRSHKLHGWNPSQYATVVIEAFETASQEPLIRYHTVLTVKSNLQALRLSHPFDELTRQIILSKQIGMLPERKKYIVALLSELLEAINPRSISSTNSNREVWTGGVAEAITDRLKSMLPRDSESDLQFLLRTLSFEWLTTENRSILESQSDKRAIRVISALHSRGAIGLFECFVAITDLPDTLHMDHNRVTGSSVWVIVHSLMRKWQRESSAIISQK